MDESVTHWLRDGLYLIEGFTMPMRRCFRQFNKIRNGCPGFFADTLLVGRARHTMSASDDEAVDYQDGRCLPTNDTDTIILSLEADVHHARLDRKQAYWLARTLFHFWRTGEIKP
ncbi:MAG TPA: hypothetical protein VGN34_02815, partial [Ktedonobacteraceae bacterium]